MTELHKLFFESAGELVQTLNDQAMQLEKSPGNAECIRSLRRTVHTLKGDAAACSFRELSELAHEFEDVLGLENTAAAASVPAIALRALTPRQYSWPTLPSTNAAQQNIAIASGLPVLTPAPSSATSVTSAASSGATKLRRALASVALRQAMTGPIPLSSTRIRASGTV